MFQHRSKPLSVIPSSSHLLRINRGLLLFKLQLGLKNGLLHGSCEVILHLDLVLLLPLLVLGGGGEGYKCAEVEGGGTVGNR